MYKELHGALGRVPTVDVEQANNRQINPAQQPLPGEFAPPLNTGRFTPTAQDGRPARAVRRL